MINKTFTINYKLKFGSHLQENVRAQSPSDPQTDQTSYVEILQHKYQLHTNKQYLFNFFAKFDTRAYCKT